MLYLSQSRKDSSDCASKTTGMQADSRNNHTHWLMLWMRQTSQGIAGHHLPGNVAVGAQHIVALHSTSSTWIKLNLQTRTLGSKTIQTVSYDFALFYDRDNYPNKRSVEAYET